jgi:hypothetical protein
MKNGITENLSLLAIRPTMATSPTAIPISSIKVCDSINYSKISFKSLILFFFPAMTSVVPGLIK